MNYQQKQIPHVVLVLRFTCIVSKNMQTVIIHNAALHNKSETCLNYKEYVSMRYFLWLLGSNVVALLVLTHLQRTGARQTCHMARIERLYR